jgi:uncharacterized protein YecE (DUF72 family)
LELQILERALLFNDPGSVYAERFDTVEINNTFYRLPEAHVFAAWRAQIGPGAL